jgi:hypothetical protein
MYVFRPDWQEKLNRVLEQRAKESVFSDVKKFPRPTPVFPSQQRAPSERGVKHRIGVDGSTTFEVVDSDGVIQFEVKPAEKHVNRRTVAWLNRVLDAIDPPKAPLKVL